MGAEDAPPLLFVFPAQAGMNRPGCCTSTVLYCVPRTGGDEPELDALAKDVGKCSPHRRG